MNDPRWIALALALIVLVGSARLVWPARGVARRTTAQRLALCGLQLASATLLYLTLVPPRVPVAAGTLSVLTAGAGHVPWAAAPGETVLALPEATGTTQRTAPDLATALRQNPGTQVLRIIGDGLVARDRDTVLPARVHLLQPPPPRGWVALQPPSVTAPGSVFAVQARAHGVAGGRAELLDPSGQVVDRRGLADDGGVQLQGVARASGRSVFSLRLLDAGRHTVDTLAVPLQTQDQAAPRVLILAGAPGPELKYLRRWAVDTGLQVHAQANAGGGVSLGDAPIALNAARLAATDVLILDERSLASLAAAQRAAIGQALREGLGVLVRSSGALGDGARQSLRSWGLAVGGNQAATPLRLPADPEAALLQARRGPPRAATTSTAAIASADDASRRAALPVLEQLALRSADSSALLHDATGQPVGAWRRVGRGRLALLPVTDSYRLVLAGREDRHAELWSSVLASVARPLPPDALARLETATPWQGERVAVCDLSAPAQVRAADGSSVALHIDPATATARCAGYWPRQAGWHQLQQGGHTQAFYVFDPAHAQPLYRQQVREASARRGVEGATGASAAARSVPGPRWPWLLAFVLSSGLLWWLERRRPRSTGTAP